MQGRKKRWRAAWSLLVCLFTLAPIGCSAFSGLTILPDRHVLVSDAEQLRQAAVAGPPRELDAIGDSEYVVGLGDGLLILPINLDSPAQVANDQTVLPDGSIDLGQYGSLWVAGKTLAQIETEVNRLISARTPGAGFVDVRLANQGSKFFYVNGEVSASGSFPWTGNETVLDALHAAGGLTGKASRWNIILTRPTQPNACRLVLAVNYLDIYQLGDTTTNYRLMPGDRIYVPTQTLLENIISGKRFWKKERQPQVPCPLSPLSGESCESCENE